jgi:hypothetical protein
MRNTPLKLFAALFAALIIFPLPSISQSFFTSEEIQKLSRIPVKIYFNGEHYYADNLRFNIADEKNRLKNFNSQEDNSGAFLSEVPLTNLRNYYDLQSLGSFQGMWQNPLNLNDIHAVYTYSAQQSIWSDRCVQYFYSSDKGVTWSFIGNVGNPAYPNGFASITGVSSGVALIAMMQKQNAPPIIKSLIYADAFPGLGSFSELNPGGAYLYPKISSSGSILNNTKYYFLSSSDSLRFNSGLSLTANNFGGYKNMGKSSGGQYTIASGSTGYVGILYVINDNTSTDFGDVMFTQSTNYGETFASSSKIYDANFAADSLAGFYGMSLAYKNTTPYAAFEIVKQGRNGTYFPGAPNKILFWSPASNGGTPVVIADSVKVPYAPARGTNDLEAPICRPSIGFSSSQNVLYITFMSQNPNTGGNDTTSYNDIYALYTSNFSNFSSPKRMNAGYPRYDWTYPAISNCIEESPFLATFSMIVQKDTIPGSNVNSPNTSTNAQLIYIKANASSGSPLPVPPNLISPINGQMNENTNTGLSWTTTLAADIQISTDNNFTNIIHSASVNASGYQVPNGVLSWWVTYYWRVRAVVNGEPSAWSVPFHFTTGYAGVTNISNEIPSEYKLFNNYPNPFNPLTKIKFDLPKNSFVKINVYDVNGRIVHEIVNETLNAGRYETEFNAGNLSSGIYYYTISAGEFNETKKMILIK